MRNFTVIDAEQRSPEWFAARLGRLTGSCAGDILAKIKSGEAAARRNLRLRLVLERITGRPQERKLDGIPAIEDGIEREPLAFAAYEALTGDVVQRSGFLAHNVHMAGCSLDGHLGDFDRLLSIKCRQPAAHLEFMRTGKIPADAMAQMHHELWVTGASEHNYFSWNPDFPEHLQARAVRIVRTEADMRDYEQAALAFLAEVETEYQAIQTISNPTAVLRQVAGVA